MAAANAPPTQLVPATFAQRRLWFLDELEPGNLAYLIAWELRLHGTLDAAALEQAFRSLIARHKVFRTTFAAQEGEVLQQIAPTLAFSLRVEDADAETATQIAREDRRQPLDLAHGPLLRVRLLRLAPTEHLLLIHLHHIIFDGTSRAVFFRDLSELYAAHREGRPPVLPALRLQYAEFAQWQQRSLAGKAYAGLLDYWKRQLADLPPALAMPTDRPRGEALELAGATLPFTLPHALSLALQTFARAHGVSLFMLLLAGFQLLLARYTGQDDLLTGVPVAGRTRTEFEQMIGLFANQIVLRLRLAPADTFGDVLAQVRNTALDAFEHQAMPFDRLVQELNPERALDRNPLFQAVFSQRNFHQQELTLAGLERVEFAAIAGTAARFDLSMIVAESDNGISGTVEYHAGLFDRATIARMLGHYRMLLAGGIADPARRVVDLPLLTPQEQQQALHGAVESHVERTLTPIPEQFERQAALTPDRTALAFGATTLSYAELNRQANRYARRLRQMGAGPGVIVALCLNRTPHLPAAILGILKAGAAYLPLDPDYPPERIAGVLADAQAPLAITERALAGRFAGTPAELLLAEDDRSQLDDTNLGLAPALESLAYVLFTSGSTGRPKGCQIEHRNLAHYLGWAGDFYFSRPEQGSFPLFTSIGFDLTVTSLFLPLLRGCTLHLLAQEAEIADLLTAAFTTPGIDAVKLTPAHVTLLQYLGLGSSAVELAIVGGEVFTPAQAAILHGLNPRMRIVNEYGPTETTVGCIVADVLPGARRVLIGRPIENTAVFVLDAGGNPVPDGLPGELYLGGRGVGRGYLHRDELTQQAFLPSLLDPAGRMYRTGDLVRRLPDGNLDYLGRADQQVKIRGFRIEPGEVESVLLAHAGISDCIVLARAAPTGGLRLVAYVVPAQDAATAALADDLQAWAARQLPAYMVPAAIVLLAAMPLSANGKIDRRALPEPGVDLAQSTPFCEPRTPLERQLAALWAEVLQLPRVGVEDNFFALGGHSLLATQIVSRIRRVLGVPLPLRTLFECPTVALLAVAVEPLLTHTAPAAGPRHAPRDQPLPLSFAQQRLWFLAQLEPHNPLYNAPSVMRLQGPLDAALLDRALQAVSARHEVLRTHFGLHEGEPVQVIAPLQPVPFTVVELDPTAPDLLEHTRRRAVAAAAEPFDLSRGPLIRATLLRLAPGDHVLILNTHHAISDGWSMEVLWKELAALYAAFAAGREPHLPALALQYADFALWQRGLEGGEQDRQLDFWKRTLAGAPPILELPADRPRPRIESFRGGRLYFHLPAAVLQAVRHTAQQEGATVFMTLLAAFNVLLARLSGQAELVVGTPASGRNSTELENLIGLFTNTLLLRATVDGAMPFRQLLAQVRETTLAAYANQDVPLEKLVEVLNPDRDLSRNPLFQVMLVYTDIPAAQRHLGNALAEPFPIERQSSKLDLTLYAGEQDGGLRLSFEYNTDLFDRATLERMAGYFSRIVAAVSANPALPCGSIPLLDADQRHQILEQWNATACDYPRGVTLHRLFERQAALTPGAEACADETRSLSYLELNALANRIAHHLRQRGVGAGTLVGVCLHRTVELPAVLLGILKCGAAYLPLDPAYPAERLQHILADSETALVVTGHAVAGKLPPFTGTVLPLEEMNLAAGEAQEDATADEDPGSLAYVLHTSGSTGQPKGVEITHRNLVNFLLSMQREPGLAPSDTLLAVTTLSFDIAGLEIYLPLITGARVVLAAREDAADALRLIALLERWQVTVMQATPSTWMLLREAGWQGSPTLKALCGGEPLPPDLAAWLLPRTAQLWNMYGPTETTIWSSLSRVLPGHAITIGRPIANTSFYVLDANRQPVPPGVAGELFIGGEGVARGYWRRPELTLERFLPNPFRPGERMYRTGDVAHFTPAGEAICSGRADNQVKIRGYRIELGEIEAALARNPHLAECVALVRESRPGDRQLVAFAVARSGTSPTPAGLREALAATLPEYMIPAALVLLPALPRTANGKLDRRALLALETEEPESSLHQAPRNALEEVLCELFAGVLGLERVGIEDNFFHLGGHSLLATRTLTRIRQAFAVELPLLTFFEFPTVAGLAPRIAALQAGPAALPPLVRANTADLLPLSYAQQRLWFLDQLEPGSPSYNLPWATRLSGPLDVTALAAALTLLATRHDSLRTTFRMQAGEPHQVIAPTLPVPLPLTDLSRLAPDLREHEATRLAREEAGTAFDLAEGPLFRACLLRLTAQDHVLVLNLHHAIADGWSLGILAQDLAELYEAARTGATAALPALPLRYADFVLWQRRYLAQGALARQLAYWKSHLAAAPPSIELATDRPRPSVQSFAGAKAVRHVPAAVVEELARLGRQEGATLFVTLLAVFYVLLARYTSQTDLVLGTAIAGRHYPDTEGVVGLFANTLVLRADLSGDPTFRDLLHRTRALTLDAFANQDVPFEKLVEELNPVRDLSRSPVVQALFVQQNAFTRQPTFGSLGAQPFAVTGSEAKFDLTLNVAQTPAGELRCALEYSTALYDADTIERMLGHYENLLTAFALDPTLPILAAPLVDEAERTLLLDTWAGPTLVPAEAALHHFFERQAGRTPGAIALVAGRQQLTYGELNRQANQVAHWLLQHAAGRETLVGLFCTRGPALLAAMLGILKAGCAYVPLDPVYPRERIAAILGDAHAPLLLTERSLAAELPSFAGTVLHLDAHSLAAQPDTNPNVPTALGDLAYVLFTSGSTGRPKGVAIEHRSAVTFVAWALTVYSPQELAGVLFSTSVCFDLSIFEIFVPLAVGGTIVLAENALYLPELPGRDAVTLINTVPSAIAELVRLRAIPPMVRTINLAGEALRQDLVDEVYAHTRATRVYNLYGPTEDTTYSTCTLLARGAPVTIGRPLANTQALVLDRRQRLVPQGVPGELYLAGEGLARGYHGRPDLTAERFVQNPYREDTRMYRTGDLCRWLRDGTLQYLGRLDHQVKLRGFRIELGEIETALGRHPAVRECAVIVLEDSFLAAYVVPAEPAQSLPVAVLRAYLKQHLPAYMVPRAWVQMPLLPLAPTGKVDRKALPAPAPAALREDEEQTLLTPLQELVAGIFAEVLHLDHVGLDENFFEAGGHSLSATQVIARLRQALAIELPLRTLFEAPTVAELAERLAAAPGNPAPPPLVPVARDGPLPLSFAQQRLWFLTQMEPGNALYNASMALRMTGILDCGALQLALNHLVARHEILRTTYRLQQDQPVQIIAPAHPVPLTVQAHAEGLLAEEAARPFDLAAGPILRAHLLVLGPQEHVLLLNTHHIATDGWSGAVLLRDLGAFYTQALAGQEPALPPLALQYADYAVWQRQWLQGPVLEAQLAFWRQALAGAPPLLALPADFPRPEEQTGRGGTHSFHVPVELQATLRHLARAHGVTSFMLLLAAFQTLLLHLVPRQTDLVLGTDLANRAMVETEDLIGFFINLLALRVDLSGDPTFPDLLGRVRRVTLDAYAHQDVPFDKLVEELQPARSRSHHPIVQALFVQQNTPRGAPEFPGLVLTGVRLSLPSKFDMAVFLRESEAGIQGIWQYNAGLFRPETIERMARLYVQLLEAIAASPESTLSELGKALTTREERQAELARDAMQEASRLKLKGLKRRSVPADNRIPSPPL